MKEKKEVVGPAGRVVIQESEWPFYKSRGYKELTAPAPVEPKKKTIAPKKTTKDEG